MTSDGFPGPPASLWLLLLFLAACLHFFFFCQRPCGFASSTSALPAASATLHTRAHRKMQTVASFGQKGVLMEDEKPVRLLTEGGKKRSRWKRVDGGGGSLFSLKSVFRRKRGTNFRLKGQSTPKSNLDPSSELQLL